MECIRPNLHHLPKSLCTFVCVVSPVRIALLAWAMSVGAVVPALAETPVDAQPARKPAKRDVAITTKNIEDGKRVLAELPAQQVGERAAKLLVRLNDIIAASARYKHKLKTAGAEDEQVLRLLMASNQKLAFDDFHELADILFDLETETPQPELRAQVKEVFKRTVPILKETIDQVRTRIDAARDLRTTAAVADRQGIETQITELTKRLNNLYRLSFEHLQKEKLLGLDTLDITDTFGTMLAERADELAGRIRLDLNRIDDYDAQLETAPDQPDTPLLLTTTKMSLKNNTDGLAIILDLMDEYKLPTEQYRALLLSATRDISRITIDKKIASTVWERLRKGVEEWAAENGQPLIIKLFLFIGILAIFYLIGHLVKRVVNFGLRRSKIYMSRLLRRMIVSWSSNLIMLIGILLALTQVGVDLGPLLAGLGIAGLAIGFALQDTIANFASGMMILLYRPYDVGDMLDTGGILGRVDKMTLVSTSILTLDNQTLIVPNKKIWSDVIKNVTAQGIRRIDMSFGISYSDDIHKAEQVLMEILEQHEKVMEHPEPVVRLHNLGNSSVDFTVRPWVNIDDYLDVYWDVTRAVKMRFDEEGISIPFPQRDVHIYEEHLTQRPTE